MPTPSKPNSIRFKVIRPIYESMTINENIPSYSISPVGQGKPALRGLIPADQCCFIRKRPTPPNIPSFSRNG